MDLEAYARIDELSELAKSNGIEIPRLRGYRLMEFEYSIPESEIKRAKDECAIDIVRRFCNAEPYWNLHRDWLAYIGDRRKTEKYYLAFERSEEGVWSAVGVRWDRIHGKKRKILKYAIKQKQRKIEAQLNMWNKYAGQPGILYIHSRMGGDNWKNFENKDSILKQPWFLDRVDDWWDGTYCDFYAKIPE